MTMVIRVTRPIYRFHNVVYADTMMGHFSIRLFHCIGTIISYYVYLMSE